MRIQSLALRMPHDSLMAKAQLRKCLLEVRELNKVLMQKAKFIISIVNKRQKEDDKLIEVDCLKKKIKNFMCPIRKSTQAETETKVSCLHPLHQESSCARSQTPLGFLMVGMDMFFY